MGSLNSRINPKMMHIKRECHIWNRSGPWMKSIDPDYRHRKGIKNALIAPFNWHLRKRSTTYENLALLSTLNLLFQTGKTFYRRKTTPKETNFNEFWIEHRAFRSMQNKNKSNWEIWRDSLNSYLMLRKKATSITWKVSLPEWSC